MSIIGYIDGAWHVITFKDHPNPVGSIQLQTIAEAPCGATLDHIPLLGTMGIVPDCAECLKVFVPEGPKEWRPTLPPRDPWQPELDSMATLFRIVQPPFRKKLNAMVDWREGESAAMLAAKAKTVLALPEKREELLRFLHVQMMDAFKLHPELAWLQDYSMVINEAVPETNDLPSVEVIVKLPKKHTLRGRLTLNVEA